MPVRVLDYGRLRPFSNSLGRPRNLAWPVHAFRVTLPRPAGDRDGLNLFERVILKLLAVAGPLDAQTLKKETCLPLDLVKGVLLRLRDKEFIDGYNALLQRPLDPRAAHEETAPIFITALVYRELATHHILPFLHLLDEKNPLRKKEDDEEVSYRRVRERETHRHAPLGPAEVVAAWRAMKKRSTAFGRDDKLPPLRLLTIAPQPERYYLDCPIAIQKSDGEFRIADPFGYGFSLVLESAFAQLLEQDGELAAWLQQWKHELRNPRPPKTDAAEGRAPEPFDRQENWDRYPKLIARLRPPPNAPFRSLAAIHAALEWALFYACASRPFDRAVTRLKFAGLPGHPALLAKAAERIGLEPPPFGFRSIPEGKLLDFQDGQAELGTVLAVALLQAEEESAHPLALLAARHPDLVSRLLGLKKRRDEKQHGQGGADAPEGELPDDAFMREIVHTLLPDIRFADSPAVAADREARADSLLEARASIQGEFGFKTFNRFGGDLQERLIHAERFWLACRDGEDALAFACDLYAAVQAVLQKALAGKLPPELGDAELVGAAEEKAARAGLGEELPASLRGVKVWSIRQTLLGAGQTLGSCAVAFLLMAESETLRAIADLHPAFLDDIAGLIAQRGHGNEPLPLAKLEIANLRKTSYAIIKTLLEG